jgi:hypothetical protein
MSATTRTTTGGGGPVDDEETPARDKRLLVVVGVLGVLSAVVAGFVILSSGGGPAPVPDADAPLRAGAHSLLMGRADAPTKVVVFEDLASPQSRAFDIASRDFLDAVAAKGHVQVEYQPVTAATSGYPLQAASAWSALLRSGTPRQVMRFQQELFDRQPDAGQAVSGSLEDWARKAGVTDDAVLADLGSTDQAFLDAGAQAARAAAVQKAPAVTVDGEPLTAASPVALADELQRQLLRKAA